MPHTEAAKTDSPKTIVRGACPHDCPDTCAMLVTVEDGRVIEVRGNPDHPFTRGALCVKVNDYEERVYSPDRVLQPLRRAGRKGSGKFERASPGMRRSTRSRAAPGDHRRVRPAGDTALQLSRDRRHLNGLNVGDAFFNRLGATITERTFCDSGDHRLHDDGRPHAAAPTPRASSTPAT